MPCELTRPHRHRLAQSFQVGQQQVRARHALQRQRGVEQVRRGQPAMNEPPRRSHMHRHLFQERDDVVVGALLVLPHLLDIEPRPRANFLRIRLGNHPDLRHALAGQHLDLEPMVQLRFLAPQSGHLLPRITGNHSTIKAKNKTPV
jgi:hypothetical protein